MKRGIVYLLAFILVISSGSMIICIVNASDNSSNNARLNEVFLMLKSDYSNKDSLIQQLKIHQFKEDFYINQIGIQSDWIILYVTVLFGIFAIVGYTFFFHKMDEMATRIDERIDEQNKEALVHKKDLRDTKLQQMKITAEMLEMTSIMDYNNQYLSSWLVNGLKSTELFSKLAQEYMKDGREDALTMKEYCQRKIDEIYVHLTNISQLHDGITKTRLVSNLQYNKVTESLNEIMMANDPEIREKTISIRILLKKMLEDLQKIRDESDRQAKGGMG